MRVETNDLKLPASIGLALTAPFLILELVSNSANGASAIEVEYLVGVTFLFAILWVLPTAFTFVVRQLLIGAGVGVGGFSILIRLVVLIALGALWVAFIADQWPCFTGVPNCD